MNNKLNIKSFTHNEMLAKLSVITMEYNRKNVISEGKKKVLEFCLDKIRNNFIYDLKFEEHLSNHLALFLLGDDNNQFSKIIK